MKSKQLKIFTFFVTIFLMVVVSSCNQEVQNNNRFTRIEAVLRGIEAYQYPAVVCVDSSLEAYLYGIDKNDSLKYYRYHIPQIVFDSLNNFLATLALDVKPPRSGNICDIAPSILCAKDTAGTNWDLNWLEGNGKRSLELNKYLFSELDKLMPEILDMSKDSLYKHFTIILPPPPMIKQIQFTEPDVPEEEIEEVKSDK